MKRCTRKPTVHAIRIPIKMRGIVLVLVLFFLACHGQKKVVENTSKQDNGPLVLLVQDAFFPTDSLETHVIKDAKALNAFFREVNKTRKPGLPIPSVDFQNEMVLIACMGKMEGDILPELRISKKNEGELVVAIELQKKPSSTSLNTYPFCVYKMAKTDIPVSFKME